ncbi:LCP family protein [Mordavella massiliensis]|uniref:LCP family glycopolymer transferase n=1 Tax=Mordavella massiliensis TaxID=1871024 RepID=UPI0021095A40|nr:LCP family protein [Mordavella massiliensis]
MAGRGRKRGRRKRHSFAAWSLGKKIGVIFGGVAFAVLSTAAVLLAGKMSKIETTKIDTDKLNISSEVEHEEGYTNIALFGLDSRENSLGKGNRSDTIMIASLNNKTKEVKLVSIYRDTLLQLDDGSYNKANSAYSFYGPEGAISMINKNLDMNIEKYVTVNFNALVDVIDAVGGLDIEMTEEEVVHMNNYCVETSEVTGKSYTKIEPEVAGTYHLNGVQAVSYSRIRYTAGGDFERASRQRHVLELIANEAQSMSLGTINKIIDEVFPQVSTNFTLTEMVSYAKDFAEYTLGDSLGFPSKNTTDMLNEVGSVVIPDTLSTNVQEVHQFLFGNDGYTVSSTVQDIAYGISERVSSSSYDSSGETWEDDSGETYDDSYDTGYDSSYYDDGTDDSSWDSSGTGDGGYTDTGTSDGWTDSGTDSGTDYGDGSTDGGYVDDSGGGSEYSGTE